MRIIVLTTRSIRGLACLILLVALAPIIAVSPAQARRFTVNKTADVVDANPGDGVCNDGTGFCTLRAAVQEANAWAGTDTILVPSGTFLFTLAGAGENSAATGDLDVTENTVILGQGSTGPIVDANGLDRVFEVAPGGGLLTIRTMTVQGGSVGEDGGGVKCVGSASLTMSEVTVRNNQAPGKKGGGISVGSGTLHLTNVTLSGNSAKQGGAISNSSGPVFLTNVTITDNTATEKGGGIVPGSGTFTVVNTIVAKNLVNPDCDAGIGPGTNSIDGDGSCGFTTTADPLLGPLQNNGGWVPTHELQAGSPAIDAGTATGGPATDARGVARPKDGDRNGSSVYDVGAFELVVYAIDGRVFEDAVGDGLPGGQAIGDAGNLARPGMIVKAYRDGGDGLPTGVDDTAAGTDTTDAAGAFRFLVGDLFTYWVAADSRTVTPSAGINAGSAQDSAWAEQTYAGVGAVAYDGAVYSYLGAAGTFYSGERDERSDNASALGTAEHIIRVVVNGADVAGVNFGMSFNVVTRTGDGDDAPGSGRTVQGTLRQFLQNANAVAGRNSSLFRIPITDSNYSASPLAYAIRPTSALPPVRQAITLDASTETGFAGSPIVELDGTNAGGATDGLTLNSGAGGSVLRGLVINRFGRDGMVLRFGTSKVAGCYVGTDVTGALDRGQGGNGIWITGDTDTIGGTSALDRNVISGNTGAGIRTSGGQHAQIRGNYVGTAADGAAALANSGHGVLLDGASLSNVIGGMVAGAGNLIAHNGGAGIAATSAVSSGNAFRRNSIHDNGALGIDLGGDGVTLNDAGDLDTGANVLLNFAVLDSADIVGPDLVLTGFAPPGSDLELFLAALDATGFGEGMTYLVTRTEGSVDDAEASTGSYGPGPVNGLAQGTDTTNRFRFTIPLVSLPGVGRGTILTTTATDGPGNTSEFGGRATVTRSLPLMKRVFLADGTPLAPGASVAQGTFLKYLLYVNNRGSADLDLSLADVLDVAYSYRPGTLKVDASSSACAAETCTGAEETAVFNAVNAAAARTDAVDGDALSYAAGPHTVYAGDQLVGNLQLDVPAGKVLAVLFTVRVD